MTVQGQESAGGDVWDWADDLWDSGRPAAGSSGSSGRQQPPEAQLQRAQQPQPMPAPELIFAEPALSQFLDMPSQVSSDDAWPTPAKLLLTNKREHQSLHPCSWGLHVGCLVLFILCRATEFSWRNFPLA